MHNLNGRTILVTGASTGIGRVTAIRLAARGANVLAGVRRPVDGESVAAEAAKTVGNVDGSTTGSLTPVRLEVTDTESIATALEGVDRLHGLVNNAGIVVSGPLEYLPLDELRHQLEVNFIGQIAVTQASMEALRRATGRIVNVSSVGGRVATPMLGAYSASKFALEAANDALRRELVGTGIRVSVVEPGGTATAIWERGLAAADATFDGLPALARQQYAALEAAARATVAQTARTARPPEKVAAVIEHALTARHPRTRYLVGSDARIGVTLAKLLPDRVLDALFAWPTRPGRASAP